MPFAGFGKGVKRMLTIHKTIDGKITPLETMEDGCWVNLTYPSEKELKTVSTALGVEPTFLRAALDEEETSRIESEDGQTLIIVDIPAVEKDEAGVVYSTLPMGIVVTDKHIITVCLKETSLIRDLQDGLVKDVRTQQRTRFILNILLLVAKRYLQYLKQIDKTYNYMESQLYKSQRNKELHPDAGPGEVPGLYQHLTEGQRGDLGKRFSEGGLSRCTRRTTIFWRTCSSRCARPSRWRRSIPPSSPV